MNTSHSHSHSLYNTDSLSARYRSSLWMERNPFDDEVSVLSWMFTAAKAFNSFRLPADQAENILVTRTILKRYPVSDEQIHQTVVRAYREEES